MPALTLNPMELPEVAHAHLPGVAVLVAAITNLVAAHNDAVERANRSPRFDEDWSDAVSSLKDKRAAIDALVAAAPGVADAERRMLRAVDGAVSTAEHMAQEHRVMGDAEPGQLSHLRRSRQFLVTTLRELRTAIGEVR